MPKVAEHVVVACYLRRRVGRAGSLVGRLVYWRWQTSRSSGVERRSTAARGRDQPTRMSVHSLPRAYSRAAAGLQAARVGIIFTTREGPVN